MNGSKEKSPIMWAKWQRSGAVGTFESAQAAIVKKETMLQKLEDKRRVPESRRGVYVFNPAVFQQKAQESIDQQRQWYSHHRSPEETEAAVREWTNYQDQLRQWSEKYSGKLPLRWGEVQVGMPWHVILRDLESHKPLTEVQIAAATEYPLSHIPRELGKNVSLTPAQLDLLAQKETIELGTFKSIVVSQRRMGASEDSLMRAEAINTRASERRHPHRQRPS